MLFVLLCVVSTVNATDNVTDDVVNVNDETDFVQTNNDNQITSEEPLSTNEGDIISASPGTFTDLANDIENADVELNLTKDYTYSSNDSSYKSGISINKPITINGNGFTINGNNQARALMISSEGVILKNITFINCYQYSTSSSVYGGAINWKGYDGILNNCTFVHCYSGSYDYTTYGCAVYWTGTNGKLLNSKFVNCYGSTQYLTCGAVYWSGSNGVLNNCSFDDCHLKGNGGAIYWSGLNGTLITCTFRNSYSTLGGGAIDWRNSNGRIINSSFINCYSKTFDGLGGAIRWSGSSGTLINCNFTNCSTSDCGGAIFWNTPNGVLRDCTFINCSSDDGFGGAIFWRTTNGNLYNCNFENCSAKYRGGAIYWLGESPIISECNFVNNNAIVGNAIWFDGKKGKLIDSYFNDEDIFNLTKFEIIDTTPKTFADLANEITNATNILILHRDYYYSNNDSSYSYGIAISKNITIEGNGYTIDAKNQARIFSIQSSTVVLKDINFINGYINLGRKIGGGGISIANSANVTIINCTFINCSSMDYNSFGGAIKCMGSLINIYNSTFEGNNAGYGGCAISAGDYSTSNIINSTFINNYETRGVISLSGTGVISNCIFINNSASTAGVVIRLGEFNGVINNSIFLNNTRYSIDSDDNGPVFVTIINNWFGNTVQDYSIKPQVYTGTLKNWLFLNSSCIENYDYEKLFNIKFSFFSYDAVSKLTRPSEIYPNINLTLSAINGTLNKQYATMNEDVIYIIVNQSGMVSAKYDNLQFDVIVKQIPIEKLVQNFTVRVLNTTFNKDAQIIVNIPNGKGNVTIKIANVTFENLIIKDGVVVQNISNFDAGQYLVNVTYNGNKYYNSSSQIVNLTIQKASSTIKVHVKDSKYGEEVIVNVTSDINCQLSVKINNTVKNVDIVANELQSINFGKLNAGNYTVIVLFNGNKNYKNTSYTKEFKVSKTESSLTVQNKEVSVDGTVAIDISLPYNATGNVKIIFENNETNIPITSSVMYWNVTPTKGGNYTVIIEYAGDNNYFAIETNFTLVVNKLTPHITVNCSDFIVPNESYQITVNLPTDAIGKVIINLNDINYTIEDITTTKSLIIPKINEGNHSYTLYYFGDDKYKSYITTESVLVNINRNIKIDATNMTTTNKNGKYELTLLDAKNNPLPSQLVIVYIDNDEYEVTTNKNGIATIYYGLNSGEHELTIQFNGTSIYNSAEATFKIIIQSIINDNDVSIPSLNTGSGTVKLPNDASGTITVDIAGKKYDFPVVNGIADVKLPELANGNYGYIIVYSGDTKYASFTKTGSVTVNKQTTPTTPVYPTKPVVKTTIILKTVKIKKSAKKLVLQATLKQGKTPLKSKKIVFKFNGKKYTAKTNKNGVAKVTIKKKVLKKLKVGKKVKYQASYGKIIVKKTAKIKK